MLCAQNHTPLPHQPLLRYQYTNLIVAPSSINPTKKKSQKYIHMLLCSQEHTFGPHMSLPSQSKPRLDRAPRQSFLKKRIFFFPKKKIALPSRTY